MVKLPQIAMKSNPIQKKNLMKTGDFLKSIF